MILGQKLIICLHWKLHFWWLKFNCETTYTPPHPPWPLQTLGCKDSICWLQECSPQQRSSSQTQQENKRSTFHPHTPGGELARKIQGEEDKFSDLHQVARVKVVERGGTQLADILGRKDPWARSHCGKGDCLICCAKAKKEWTPSTCRQESMVYAITCDRCKDAQVDAKYYEETSQNGIPPWTRALTWTS